MLRNINIIFFFWLPLLLLDKNLRQVRNNFSLLPENVNDIISIINEK